MYSLVRLRKPDTTLVLPQSLRQVGHTFRAPELHSGRIWRMIGDCHLATPKKLGEWLAITLAIFRACAGTRL